MKKKFLTIILVVLLALTVFGCGKKNKKVEEPTEKETENVTKEQETTAETDVAETEAATEEETEYVEREIKVGEVMLPEDFYRDNELTFVLDGKERNVIEHLEYTKTRGSENSSKYRDLYVSDIEAIPFTIEYLADEDGQKVFSKMSKEELEKLALGAGEIAQKFALVFYACDSNGPVYGYPGWDFKEYTYENNVPADAARSLEALYIMGMKLADVCLRASGDGTIDAIISFVGCGVQADGEQPCQDLFFVYTVQMVYTGEEWMVFSCGEVNEKIKSLYYFTIDDENVPRVLTYEKIENNVCMISGEYMMDYKLTKR